jgi:hypothetical protein
MGKVHTKIRVNVKTKQIMFLQMIGNFGNLNGKLSMSAPKAEGSQQPKTINMLAGKCHMDMK